MALAFFSPAGWKIRGNETANPAPSGCHSAAFGPDGDGRLALTGRSQQGVITSPRDESEGRFWVDCDRFACAGTARIIRPPNKVHGTFNSAFDRQGSKFSICGDEFSNTSYKYDVDDVDDQR
ncbi:hypothetical protein FVEG_09734 [Fusarium verticillioides 7600]|uniref:Uncharacterized protein n=1 Tax=Gibberella moniliformis (strain M3125 / FGSC 7600) TaxID=334819 RepID=W7MSC3_GIBM7|nr:hypothetical protein FVEG_09734 [Fusarium verticillioides 7600]EWG50545.1 hypothetical protein FVEG_09734 [Fusarium verticillioides 7600]